MEYKSSVEEVSDIARNINFEIPRNLYQEKYNKLLSKTASTAHLKGFRPGKAPRDVIVKFYGERIHSDVMGQLVSDAYQKVIEGQKFKVIGYPDIKIDDEDKNKDLKVTAAVSIFPEPEIKKYRKLKLSVALPEYSDEELENRLKALCEQQAKIEKVTDRETAKEGDLVVVHYHGKIDGEEVPELHGHDRYIELGKDRFPKDLEQAIVGMNVGEAKEVEVKLNKAFGAKLEDKDAVIKVELKALHSKNVPELTDEVAKNSGLAENVSELREVVKKQLEKEFKDIRESRVEEELFKQIIEANPFNVPQVLIDGHIRNLLFEIGLLNPKDRKSWDIDVSRFKDIFGEKAEHRAKREVALERILAVEEPKAGKEEVEAWLQQMAEKEAVSIEEVNKHFRYPEDLDNLIDFVKRKNLVTDLIASATISETTEEAEEPAKEKEKKPKKTKAKKEE